MALLCRHCGQYYNPADPSKMIGCDCDGATKYRADRLQRQLEGAAARRSAPLRDRLLVIADESESGRNLAGTPQACREAAEALSNRRITTIRVVSMRESCQRTTFFVELATDEGFTITPCSHQTGSIYTDHVGLTIEEARDRALIDAADWGDLLQIAPEPFTVDGVVVQPSMTFDRYTTRRVLAARKEQGNG